MKKLFILLFIIFPVTVYANPFNYELHHVVLAKTLGKLRYLGELCKSPTYQNWRNQATLDISTAALDPYFAEPITLMKQMKKSYIKSYKNAPTLYKKCDIASLKSFMTYQHIRRDVDNNILDMQLKYN